MSVSCRTIDVSVHCEGLELRPYGVEYSDPSTVTAYITSEAGKTFAISCRNNTAWSLSASLHVDGHRVRKSHIRRHHTKVFEGARVNDQQLVPLLFGNLELVDSDSDSLLAHDVGSIGEISLTFTRTVGSDHSSKVSKAFADLSSFGSTQVSERCKKAGAHRVLLNEDSPIASKASWKRSRRVLDTSGNPYVTFKFKYLPEQLLRAREIIPYDSLAGNKGRKRPVSDNEPGPSQAKRPREADRKLYSSPDIKPVIHTRANLPDPGVVIDLTTLEYVAAKQESTHIFANEVIDLTDD